MVESSNKPKSSQQGTGTYSHGDFMYVRRKKRGRVHHEDESEKGELNIVPYLDIVINLIMFLLVGQATLVSLGVIDVGAPSYSTVGPGPTSGEDDPSKKLRLTVGVAKEGFYIAATGGVLPGAEVPPEGAPVEASAKAPPTIPRKADGSYDYPALARKLRGIKTAFPDATSLFLTADQDTQYEVIVKTLDASREDAQGVLFPAVAFTQMN